MLQNFGKDSQSRKTKNEEFPFGIPLADDLDKLRSETRMSPPGAPIWMCD